MIDVPTVRPAEISHMAPADVAGWTGFAQARPGEAVAAGPPSEGLGPDGWRARDLSHAGFVTPLGCHLLRDVDICRTGYAFHHGRFVHDWSHTSAAALGWLRRAEFPGNPLTDPPARRIRVDRPVLLAFGAGYPVYGHWLLDFLPRIAVARAALGEAFAACLIPLPADAPEFVAAMLRFFLDIPDGQIRRFDPATELLACARVAVPTPAHDGDYLFHGFFRQFYRAFVPIPAPDGPQKICLSRQDLERGTRGAWRVFEARQAFERLATAHGYAIVQPERLSLRAQIALFAGVTHVVGEHGSALHNTVFAPSGTVCGYVPLTNDVQIRIGHALRQPNIFIEHAASRTGAHGERRYTVPEAELAALFARMDAALPCA